MDLQRNAVAALDEAPREALVYVPGLAALGIERRTTTGVVRRLQRAFDRYVGPGEVTWRVEWTDAAVDAAGSSGHGPLATIWSKEPDGKDSAGKETPVVDVFEYGYAKTLVDGWEKSSLLKRAAQVLVALFFQMPSIWRGFAAAGHSVKGRAQLVVATVMIVAMLAYAAVLLVAVLQTGQQIWQAAAGEAAPKATVETSATTESAQDATADEAPSGVTVPQWLAIAGALIAAATRKAGNRLSSAGSSLFAVNSYLSLAEKRPEVTGGLHDLCERLREQPKYTTVRMIGYSFGAVVALEALYPLSGLPPQGIQKVASLATIGAPYDFVLAVKPGWFKDRNGENIQRSWINVYSPVDLLGSNFRDDADDGDATRGISVTGESEPLRPSVNLDWELGIDMKLRNLVLMAGFTSHGMYWGEDGVDDHNVFNLVVQKLYTSAEVHA